MHLQITIRVHVPGVWLQSAQPCSNLKAQHHHHHESRLSVCELRTHITLVECQSRNTNLLIATRNL
jgi:hypothetical protein